MAEKKTAKSIEPLVTIITPTFNLIKGGRRDWFIQNLESVRNQTYKNIEHIVIDGASTDGTLDLIKEYKDKGWITYFSEPDTGIYDAMNKGIKRAKGKYIVSLNSDDFYYDARGVELLVAKATETDADATYASTIGINSRDDSECGIWPYTETDNLIFGGHACHQTFLIKTDVLKELGLYDLEYKISADTAFMYKMLRERKKFAYITDTIIAYRSGGASSDSAAVERDVTNALYKNYGRYNGLTIDDAKQLIRLHFFNLPIEKAVDLGAKLNRPEFVKMYFSKLLEHHITVARNAATLQQPTVQIPFEHKTAKRYYLFDVLPLLKITQHYGVKRYLLFGFLPTLKIKYKQTKIKSYLFGVIPFMRTSDKYGVFKLRIFGIPIIRKKHN